MKKDFTMELSGNLLEHMIPFHLVWNGSGELLSISVKAKQYLFSEECKLSEIQGLCWLHPFRAATTPEFFPELTNLILALGIESNPSRFLRGELMQLHEGKGWLFSGLPPVTSVAELEGVGLKLADLPLHLGHGDFFLATEAAKISLAESQRNAGALLIARDSLQERTELLEEKSMALAVEVKEHEQAEEMLEKTLVELQEMQIVLIEQERLKALGGMVSGISHDFNNMLTPIVSYAALLKDDESIPVEERNQYLDWILTAACDAADLIKKLRSLYKPLLTSTQFQSFSLVKVVNDALALARPRWESSGRLTGLDVTVQTQYESAPTLIGCELEVRQAIVNVLVNSGDAIEGKGEVVVGLGEDETHVWVSVEDSGLGMAVDALRQCREPFYSTKGERGSGLGLPMVYGTALRHSGHVELESELSKGTRVTLFLSKSPELSAREQARPGRAVSEEANKTSVPQDLNPAEARGASSVYKTYPEQASLSSFSSNGEEPAKTDGDGNQALQVPKVLQVMVVDDDAGALRALGKAVSLRGHELVTAEDGSEALDFAGVMLFDLIISDVDMPKLRGDDLAIELRRMQPNARVILFSGRPEDVHARGRIAADRVLGKPMEASAVVREGESLVWNLEDRDQMGTFLRSN